MLVTAHAQLMRSGLVPQPEAVAGYDFANTAQFQLRKLLLPPIQQPHGILAGHGKEQFEILAIRQCRQHRRLAAPARPARGRRPPRPRPQLGRPRDGQR